MSDALSATLRNPPATILFADVVGSVGMYERLGDAEAKAQVDALFADLRVEVERQGGTLVKRMGDELMCTFATAGSAAQAACEMQVRAQARSSGTPEPMRLRIGFHSGVLIRDAGDVYGDTVNVAARVASEASAARILTTRETANALPELFVNRIRPWRRVGLKGKQVATELVEVLWGGSDTVGFDQRDSGTVVEYRRLTLRCQGKVCTFEAGARPVSFGRGEGNDLVIVDPQHSVSGLHGRIEFHAGRMELVDTSTNGIYVAFAGEEQFFFVSKRVALRCSGRMALGRPPHDTEAVIAEFELA